MIRRLYDWVMGWSESPYAVPALFLIAFAESSFFIVPPDVLLIALAVSVPRRAFFYAAVSTVGSVLGGLGGYAVGHYAFELLGQPIIDFYDANDALESVKEQYQANAFLYIAVAGFTPIPYKVFTIAAGATQISIPVLVTASILSRGARFCLISGLIYAFGPQIKEFIDKYFNILSIVFVVLLVGGFLLIRLVGG